MTKFKVGDKVKALPHANSGAYGNDSGIVSRIPSGGYVWTDVQVGRVVHSFYESELELVIEPKFAVGEWVTYNWGWARSTPVAKRPHFQVEKVTPFLDSFMYAGNHHKVYPEEYLLPVLAPKPERIVLPTKPFAIINYCSNVYFILNKGRGWNQIGSGFTSSTGNLDIGFQTAERLTEMVNHPPVAESYRVVFEGVE